MPKYLQFQKCFQISIENGNKSLDELFKDLSLHEIQFFTTKDKNIPSNIYIPWGK